MRRRLSACALGIQGDAGLVRCCLAARGAALTSGSGLSGSSTPWKIRVAGA
jgi:hypothetical protein